MGAVFQRRRNTSRSACGGSNSPHDFGPCISASCSSLWRHLFVRKTIFMARRNRRNSSILPGSPGNFLFHRIHAAPGSDSHAADTARLAEFQRRGYYLAYLSECPIPENREPAASTIARLGPTLIRRIRFNYRPKHIAPLGQELFPLVEYVKSRRNWPHPDTGPGANLADPKDRRSGMDGTVPKGGGSCGTSRKSFFGV